MVAGRGVGAAGTFLHSSKAAGAGYRCRWRRQEIEAAGAKREPSQSANHMTSPSKASVAMTVALALAVFGSATDRATAAQTPLERGAYLTNSIVACGNCHTPKDRDGHAIADQELAGGLVIEAPVFRAVAPNITPDRDTGIWQLDGRTDYRCHP